MSQILFVSPPHLRANDSAFKRMLIWNLSLLPIAFGALAAFGGGAFLIMLMSVAGAALGEVFFRVLIRVVIASEAKQSKTEIASSALSNLLAMTRVRPDGKAMYIGLLSSFLFSPYLSPWVSFWSTFWATAISQECFGGKGASIFHPALVAFTFSQIFSSSASSAPSGNAFLFQMAEQTDLRINVKDFLWGVRSGALGEASLLMSLAGGVILLGKRMISFWPPFLFLGSVLGASFLIHANPSAELLVGSTMLVAFYIVTDYETSPIHRYGKYAYAVLCGFSFVMLRHASGRPEAALYGLLILNGFAPLFDQWLGRMRKRHA